MHLLRPRLLVTVALLTGFLLQPTTLPAADGDTARDDELRRKAQEVEKLQEELNRAQSDLKQLEAENQRLRTEKPAASPAATTPPAEPQKPTPVVATLPPFEPGQVIEVNELVGQFAAEPEAARQRYAKKLFSVTGTVAGFDPKLLTRGYDVRLDSPEKPSSITVICQFRLPDRYTAVYTKRSGQALTARVGERTEVPLLEVGDAVTIKGTCKGLKKGELTFSGCRVMK